MKRSKDPITRKELLSRGLTDKAWEYWFGPMRTTAACGCAWPTIKEVIETVFEIESENAMEEELEQLRESLCDLHHSLMIPSRQATHPFEIVKGVSTDV